jgi:hypothetical protein
MTSRALFAIMACARSPFTAYRGLPDRTKAIPPPDPGDLEVAHRECCTVSSLS